MKFWFSRKKKSDNDSVMTELVMPDDKVMLHGHDMAKWNYLGYTYCYYSDTDGSVTSDCTVFLFVDKNDDKRRSYSIPTPGGDYFDKNHQFILTSIKPWAAGEGEIWHMIKGKKNKPSDYLKEVILDKFGSEWDSATNWWGSSDDAKYTSASNKQKRERKPKEVKAVPESNVVTVEFGKQA
jgi:hypothetical protein